MPTHVLSPRERRAPLAIGLLVTAAAAAVLPVVSQAVGPRLGFLPMVLGIVGCFDVVSIYLLLRQYRADGDPRSLAMAVAYSWSLAVMLGYAGAFPGVVADPAPLASAPSVAPWLYVCWHTGFPLLLGLSWAPWPASWQAVTPASARARRVVVSQLATAAVAGGLVTTVVSFGTSLPVLITGVDTSRMTALTAPVALPLVLFAVVLTTTALRGRSGPERWTSLAVWVCLLDLCLTYASHSRFSAGWYAGRTLTVIAAGVVLMAMLHETTRIKTALATALARERQVELLQRSILDNLDDGVILTDRTGRVLMVNPAMQRLFPQVDAGRATAPLELRTPDGTPIAWQDRPAGRTALTGETLRDQLLVVGRGDHEIWLSNNSTAITDDRGDVVSVLATYSDVTERERARRELELAAVELAAAHDAAVTAERAKSSFFAATSHEIRTPLNGMLGMTSLLRETVLDDRQREFVTTAHACGKQLLALVDDVLDFSKAEAGRLVLEHRALGLAGLVDEAVAMVAETAAAKGLMLTVEVSELLPGTVLGDGLRLRQAMLNLLSNAVKFTDRGQVRLTVRPDGELVRFAVSDTGIGVDPAVVPALFEPFKQADSGTTRRFGGTGLGLAITREIAVLHGGLVGATPNPPQGSTFWFSASLPAATPLTVPRPREPSSLVGHVLLAEDNVVNQRIAELVLEGMGLTVDVVGNGREAVDAVLGGRYDVVLMDCQMPELDGLQATLALRDAGCRVPVVAITASASPDDEQRCRAAGMDDYLTKPLDAHVLAQVLEKHLATAPV